jgi:hypothetical protein
VTGTLGHEHAAIGKETDRPRELEWSGNPHDLEIGIAVFRFFSRREGRGPAGLHKDQNDARKQSCKLNSTPQVNHLCSLWKQAAIVGKV